MIKMDCLPVGSDGWGGSKKWKQMTLQEKEVVVRMAAKRIRAQEESGGGAQRAGCAQHV